MTRSASPPTPDVVQRPRPPGGVSICISNWNHKSYLPRSLGSALKAAAALEDAGLGCQVLVVDDGSRDGSQRCLFTLATTLGRGRLDVHLAPANRGLAATRNAALKAARYRYVCILDADNELIPENLPLFHRAAMESQGAFVYGNLIVVEDGLPKSLISSEVPKDALLELNYIDAFAILDADRVLDLGGYHAAPYTRAHEDWDLLLHLISEGQRIVFVPAVLGRYYREPESMIQTTAYEHSRLRRVYNQRRAGLPLSFEGPLVYHPDIGYL